MRFASLIGCLAATLVGCSATCEDTGCPASTYCSRGTCIADCVINEDCMSLACDPTDACCGSSLFCSPDGRCVGEQVSVDECSDTPVFPPDGWDDPPGAGPLFIMRGVGLGDAGIGRNIDNRCNAMGCIDNALAPLGLLVNSHIRQLLLGGETLMAIEVAGLSPSYRGNDRSVTIKIYSVRDADNPFFPANNFKIPPGHTTCCQFTPTPQTLSLAGVARARMPARIRNERILSTEGVAIPLTVATCPPPYPELDLRSAEITAELPVDLRTMSDVVLTGVLPVTSLVGFKNPYCGGTTSPLCNGREGYGTLHELIADTAGIQPDIDVDGDGNECAYDLDFDGVVDTCCDGADDKFCAGGDAPCVANRILPIDPTDPSSCRSSPRFADGYSVSFTIDATEATFVDPP